MTTNRLTYADAVRTRVRLQYADDEITVPAATSTDEMTRFLTHNQSGYMSLDWRSYKTPMMVS